MTDEIPSTQPQDKPPGKPPGLKPPAPAPDVDLSLEINAAVAARTGETVRCVRVFGDSYRCNWWGRGDAPVVGERMSSGFEVSELRVRRSSFLKVRKTAEGLKILDVTQSMPGTALVK